MTSSVPVAFYTACQRYEVPEEDYLLLEAEGVQTKAEFYFRRPSEAALEAWINEVMFQRMGARDADTHAATAVDRNATESEREFRDSQAVAAIRRLWLDSKTAAVADIQAQAIEAAEDRPRRVNTTVIEDMMTRGRLAGLDDSIPSRRPANLTISKTYLNYSANGQFRYIYFEEHISQEEEEMARSQGLVPTRPSMKLEREGLNSSPIRAVEDNFDMQKEWIEIGSLC